jgi:hypothetical protein
MSICDQIGRMAIERKLLPTHERSAIDDLVKAGAVRQAKGGTA